MSARSTSENCGPSASSRATWSSSTASRASPSCSERPGLAGERADLELGRAGRADVAARRREELGRLGVAVRLGQSLGPGEQRLDPAAEVGRDAAAEERRIDAELRREPRDRLGGGARLAALDLADVLLREPIARRPGTGSARPRGGASAAARRGARSGADGVVAAGAVATGACSSSLRGTVGGGVHLCLSQGDSPLQCTPPEG